jgi:hypothetical protein
LPSICTEAIPIEPGLQFHAHQICPELSPSAVLDANPIGADGLFITQCPTPFNNSFVHFRSGSEWWFVKANIEFITRLKTTFRLKVHAVTGYVAQLSIAVKPCVLIGEHNGALKIQTAIFSPFQIYHVLIN